MARFVALCYAAAVIGVMALSFWPDAYNGSRLLALILSLPWGLIVELVLDVIDPALISSLGPPLMAMGGLLNAFLLFNALRGSERAAGKS